MSKLDSVTIRSRGKKKFSGVAMAEEGCVDLRKTWPGYMHAWEDPNCEKDAYGVVIIGRYGHIAPSGGRTMLACIEMGKSKAARDFREGKFPATVIQDADSDGLNAEFEVEDWEEIFSAIKARRRRNRPQKRTQR